MSSHHHPPENETPSETIELHAAVSVALLAEFRLARSRFDAAEGADPINWTVLNNEELIGMALRDSTAHYRRAASDIKEN